MKLGKKIAKIFSGFSVAGILYQDFCLTFGDLGEYQDFCLTFGDLGSGTRGERETFIFRKICAVW
jgi:hypothetical protein